jgi:hypothetical protein
LNPCPSSHGGHVGIGSRPIQCLRPPWSIQSKPLRYIFYTQPPLSSLKRFYIIFPSKQSTNCSTVLLFFRFFFVFSFGFFPKVDLTHCCCRAQLGWTAIIKPSGSMSSPASLSQNLPIKYILSGVDGRLVYNRVTFQTDWHGLQIINPARLILDEPKRSGVKVNILNGFSYCRMRPDVTSSYRDVQMFWY